MQLLPCDDKVFDLIAAHANIAHDAAGVLCDAVVHGEATALATAAARIGEMEGRGDQIVLEIRIRLHDHLVGSFDPDDLATLASRLDDVLDGIEDVAHRFNAYRVSSIPQSAIRFCMILRSCSQRIAEAASALANKRSVLPYCCQLHALENDADELGRSCLMGLFNTGSDPITIIKWKEIYEFLERTTDRCEDVADALQSIAAKNG